MEKMNEAIERSQCRELSSEENREFKKLYREVVKLLHPDLNPDASEAQIKLFENAVQAYRSGDLGTLRMIHEMIAGQQSMDDAGQDTWSILRKQREELAGMIAAVRESIARIKAEYPFTVLEILNDSEKLSERRKELEYIMDYYNELIQFYAAKLQETLR